MPIKRYWPITWLALFATISVLSVYLFSGLAAEKQEVAKQPAEKPAVAKPTGNDKSSKFLRITRDDQKRPIAMEAAIVTYTPKDRSKTAPTVDLISAVHIGERTYYEQLNREFKAYDVVLYELVAPEGTRVPKGGGKGSGSVISMIQKTMKNMLELEFQLEAIDYTQPNFVHADMSPAQFAESMKNRGDSMIKMFIRMMAAAMAAQDSQAGPASDLDMLKALFDKDRAITLKRIMAEQFQSMDGMLTAIEGPNGSTLITDRNKIALSVLRKQIDKSKKKIAIFYGGGHMPDFDKQLREQFGLIPVKTRWLVAWDLKQVPPKAEAVDADDAKDAKDETVPLAAPKILTAPNDAPDAKVEKTPEK
jgi:hypothetical protein